VSFLCGYLGISRQGYYRHVDRILETDVLRTSIVLYCQDILKDMPKAGMRELYELCRRRFGQKFTIGRDQCFDIFRSNGLCQRRRKRPRTTNSNHNYYIYPDLLNTSPKLRPERFGQLCVVDITYVDTSEGWSYLSLVTDAASRMIVGWALSPTLSREGPMQALSSAIELYTSKGVDLSGLIHHSDRGVQYCCNEYVGLLKSHSIRISMTQTGDPLHNALAERMNNTVKNGWLFDTGDKSPERVRRLVERAVWLYNNVRPHQSLGMRTPMEEMERLLSTAA
jgi:transposase InsO family protein